MIKIGDVLNGFTVVMTGELSRERVVIVGWRPVNEGRKIEWVAAPMAPNAGFWDYGYYSTAGWGAAFAEFARYMK